MLDLREVAKNFEFVLERLGSRQGTLDLGPFQTLFAERKTLHTNLEHEQARRNKINDELKVFASKEPSKIETVRGEMKALSVSIKEREARLKIVEDEITALLMLVPNVPHPSVPVGKTVDDNVMVRSWGEKPSFSFQPKEHFELGEAMGLFDFQRAAKVSGSRFAFSLGALAKLERALVSFMLDEHTQNGYQEMLPPYLVNRQSMTGTGQLPKFEDDAFKTSGAHELFLIPTAEVPLTNFHADEVLETALPLKYCAFSPCFRAEAGSAGKDTKGLIRVHQFHKVELVKLASPETSLDELESMTQDACRILEKLNLHHRVMLLCTADMGFCSQKTYDIEVWLPGQNAYREISSCSDCGDFQARRAKIRSRQAPGSKPRLVHTLNGSALAVGRTLIALLENGQRADGSVQLPEVLWPYMQCKEISAGR